MFAQYKRELLYIHESFSIFNGTEYSKIKTKSDGSRSVYYFSFS